MDRTAKFKEAFKTALSMTIAYGIALGMNWDKPMWAGFAVAFISLGTTGQSFNKGAMRILGTAVAVVVSLVLIAAFPQNRWWFMAALSIYIGGCTYMNVVSRYQYFWYASGFVTAVICLEAGPVPIRAFETAMMRAQETGLGVLVYTLIATLLWPRSDMGDFKAMTSNLISAHRRLCQAHLNQRCRETSPKEIQSLREQEIQDQREFDQLLQAVESESHEVWELRRQWRRFRAESAEFMEALERLGESLSEVRELDLNRLIPDLDLLSTTLDQRFAQIERMLAGESPQMDMKSVDFSFNRDALPIVSHFQKAALAVIRAQVPRLESITQSMFHTVQEIKGFVPLSPQKDESGFEKAGLSIDPDGITAAVRVMAGLWLAYLIWIYVEVPGGTLFIIMMCPVGIMLATKSQIPVPALFLPFMAGLAVGGGIHVLVMPKLSTFAGLGSLIFAFAFVVWYAYGEPGQFPFRAIGLGTFAIMTGISNEQSYSFLMVANVGLMFVLALALLAFAAHIPVSPRPEKAFIRLLRRFFRSAEFLMSRIVRDPSSQRPFMDAQRTVFHRRELRTIPAKLEGWARCIDHKKFPNNAPEQVEALVVSLQGLAYRIEQLLETAGSVPAESTPVELLGDLKKWRTSIVSSFEKWSEDLGAEAAHDLDGLLRNWVALLEKRIEEDFEQADGKPLVEEASQPFYGLLAGFRGVSQDAVAYAAIARTIDWEQWREEMF